MRPTGACNSSLKHLVEAAARRIHQQRHFLVGRDARALLGERNGVVEAAELVDQAELPRLLRPSTPGPAPPRRSSRASSGARRRPARRTGRRPPASTPPSSRARRREAAVGRVHLGVLAAGWSLSMLAPSFSSVPADHELPRVDADRSGQRARLRDDGVAADRDVVAARRGQVRHRHDDRPARAAREIDSSRQMTSEAVDDPPGLSTRSTMARTARSARALRMYSTSESEPTTAPLTGSKPLLPDAMTPTALITATRGAARDARPTPTTPSRSRRPRSSVAVRQVGVHVVELVVVRHVVDQAQAQGLVGQERALVDERRARRPRGLRRPSAMAAHELLVLVAIERLAHLAVRGREALLGRC